jgi:endonuclease G, mitochondrial
MKLWLGLEDHVQEHADTFDRTPAVLAGPVLDPADPPYRGIQVPLRFRKVVASCRTGRRTARSRPPATCWTSRRWSRT